MRLNQCRTHDIRIREFEDASIEVIQNGKLIARAWRQKDTSWTSETFSGKQAKDRQQHSSRVAAIGRLVSGAITPGLEKTAAGGG